VTVMDEYRVRIGDDLFVVNADDNQGARYKASELFKQKYDIEAWLTSIADHAKAKLVTAPDALETTEEVLESLRKEIGLARRTD